VGWGQRGAANRRCRRLIRRASLRNRDKWTVADSGAEAKNFVLEVKAGGFARNFQVTCHGSILFNTSTVLDNKKDPATRDDMIMLLAVLTPTIGHNRWKVTDDREKHEREIFSLPIFFCCYFFVHPAGNRA
jgi:hypothetical protein